jgi:hypothetical protein
MLWYTGSALQVTMATCNGCRRMPWPTPCCILDVQAATMRRQPRVTAPLQQWQFQPLLCYIPSSVLLCLPVSHPNNSACMLPYPTDRCCLSSQQASWHVQCAPRVLLLVDSSSLHQHCLNVALLIALSNLTATQQQQPQGSQISTCLC